jgi:hypothetical protein
MPQLALDDVERDTLVGAFDGAGAAELARRNRRRTPASATSPSAPVATGQRRRNLIQKKTSPTSITAAAKTAITPQGPAVRTGRRSPAGAAPAEGCRVTGDESQTGTSSKPMLVPGPERTHRKRSTERRTQPGHPPRQLRNADARLVLRFQEEHCVTNRVGRVAHARPGNGWERLGGLRCLR